MVDIDGDDVLLPTLFNQRKLDNLRRDPRAVVSLESHQVNQHAFRPYLVLAGIATVGARRTRASAAVGDRYLGPHVRFPPMADPRDGYVTRIAIASMGGVGPWAQ